MQDVVGAADLTVLWPVAATPSGASSCDRIADSLDMLQERLERLEASLAARAPQTPPDAAHEQERREIHLLVAALAAELLGADHPLVAQLQDERDRHAGSAAGGTPVERAPSWWPAGARRQRPVSRVVSLLHRW